MELEEIIIAWWRRVDTETITDLANRIREAGYQNSQWFSDVLEDRQRYREALEKIARQNLFLGDSGRAFDFRTIAIEALRSTT